jgi:hypothetical protein
MVIGVTGGFQVTLVDPVKCLVVVENLLTGIRYEFPNEFEHLKSAKVFDSYLLVIESSDGRRKMIQLLE